MQTTPRKSCHQRLNGAVTASAPSLGILTASVMLQIPLVQVGAQGYPTARDCLAKRQILSGGLQGADWLLPGAARCDGEPAQPASGDHVRIASQRRRATRQMRGQGTQFPDKRRQIVRGADEVRLDALPLVGARTSRRHANAHAELRRPAGRRDVKPQPFLDCFPSADEHARNRATFPHGPELGRVRVEIAARQRKARRARKPSARHFGVQLEKLSRNRIDGAVRAANQAKLGDAQCVARRCG